MIPEILIICHFVFSCFNWFLIWNNSWDLFNNGPKWYKMDLDMSRKFIKCFFKGKMKVSDLICSEKKSDAEFPRIYGRNESCLSHLINSLVWITWLMCTIHEPPDRGSGKSEWGPWVVLSDPRYLINICYQHLDTLQIKSSTTDY